MGKVLLWLVWIVELLLFLAGAGCVLLLSMVGDMGYGAVNIFPVIVLIGIVALCGYGVLKAARALSGSGDRSRLAIYLSIPVLALLLFAGGVVILMNV